MTSTPSQAHDVNPVLQRVDVKELTGDPISLLSEKEQDVVIERTKSRYQEEEERKAKELRQQRQRPQSVATPRSIRADRTGNQAIVANITIATWGEGEVAAMHTLMMKESGYNHLAKNPRSTAYGMFQFLDSTWRSYGCVKSSDPEQQTICGVKYIKARYGSPSKALAFHRSHNWY